MKALFAVLMITGMMSVFVLLNLDQGQPAGAVVNEVGKIRLDRIIQAGQGFPYSYACKEQLAGIDQLMRLNADSRHYTPSGIQDVETFFTNEKVLYSMLESVSKTGKCEFQIRQRANELLMNLTSLDTRLVAWTLENSGCANVELAIGNYTASQTLRQLEMAAIAARTC